MSESGYTPASDTKDLLNRYKSITWAQSDQAAKDRRNGVRQIFGKLVDAYGRDETQTLVFAFLLAEVSSDSANRYLGEILSIVATEEG